MDLDGCAVVRALMQTLVVVKAEVAAESKTESMRRQSQTA
jgi:hypothetical protein